MISYGEHALQVILNSLPFLTRTFVSGKKIDLLLVLSKEPEVDKYTMWPKPLFEEISLPIRVLSILTEKK